MAFANLSLCGRKKRIKTTNKNTNNKTRMDESPVLEPVSLTCWQQGIGYCRISSRVHSFQNNPLFLG